MSSVAALAQPSSKGFFPAPEQPGGQSLPENAYSPCARIFAVCILSGTRQREDLPCVCKKTHGNYALRRVPSTSTRRKWRFAVCQPAGTWRTWITWLARGFCRQGPHGRHCLPCARVRHTANTNLRRVPYGWHTANMVLPSRAVRAVFICCVSREAHGKHGPLPCARP